MGIVKGSVQIRTYESEYTQYSIYKYVYICMCLDARAYFYIHL